MKGLHLLSFSTPTTLSSLYNQEVVPVVGILYDTRRIYESTVQGIFHGVAKLTLNGARCISALAKVVSIYTTIQHLLSLLVSGRKLLGGIDPALKWRVDYIGFSYASQATIRAFEVKSQRQHMEVRLGSRW